jgi:hypothetical protein
MMLAEEKSSVCDHNFDEWRSSFRGPERGSRIFFGPGW